MSSILQRYKRTILRGAIMKKRLEFVMDSDEYGDVTNIVGSEKKNIEMKEL